MQKRPKIFVNLVLIHFFLNLFFSKRLPASVTSKCLSFTKNGKSLVILAPGFLRMHYICINICIICFQVDRLIWSVVSFKYSNQMWRLSVYYIDLLIYLQKGYEISPNDCPYDIISNRNIPVVSASV